MRCVSCALGEKSSVCTSANSLTISWLKQSTTSFPVGADCTEPKYCRQNAIFPNDSTFCITVLLTLCFVLQDKWTRGSSRKSCGEELSQLPMNYCNPSPARLMMESRVWKATHSSRCNASWWRKIFNVSGLWTEPFYSLASN